VFELASCETCAKSSRSEGKEHVRSPRNFLTSADIINAFILGYQLAWPALSLMASFARSILAVPSSSWLQVERLLAPIPNALTGDCVFPPWWTRRVIFLPVVFDPLIVVPVYDRLYVFLIVLRGIVLAVTITSERATASPYAKCGTPVSC
jgi:hypothetical protein